MVLVKGSLIPFLSENHAKQLWIQSFKVLHELAMYALTMQIEIG